MTYRALQGHLGERPQPDKSTAWLQPKAPKKFQPEKALEGQPAPSALSPGTWGWESSGEAGARGAPRQVLSPASGMKQEPAQQKATVPPPSPPLPSGSMRKPSCLRQRPHSFRKKRGGSLKRQLPKSPHSSSSTQKGSLTFHHGSLILWELDVLHLCESAKFPRPGPGVQRRSPLHREAADSLFLRDPREIKDPERVLRGEQEEGQHGWKQKYTLGSQTKPK